MLKFIAPVFAATALLAISAPAEAAPFNCSLPAFQRHPALANACSAIAAAYDSVVAAQNNNGFKLGGHGDAARAAIQNAYNEMLAAARTAG